MLSGYGKFNTETGTIAFPKMVLERSNSIGTNLRGSAYNEKESTVDVCQKDSRNIYKQHSGKMLQKVADVESTAPANRDKNKIWYVPEVHEELATRVDERLIII